MLQKVKAAAKNSLNPDGFAYNVLAWIYGALSSKKAIRRHASMRLRRDSRFIEDELRMAECLPDQVFDAVLAWFSPKNLLDVGCGVGLTLQYALNKGLEVCGLEGSKAALESFPVREIIKFANLNKPQFIGRKFDLVWSVEVAEHIHPKYTHYYLDTLVRHGDCVLLSAAPPGQGGTGHFNEQPQSYWIELMRQRGFGLEVAKTQATQSLSDKFAANMMLFLRSGR